MTHWHLNIQGIIAIFLWSSKSKTLYQGLFPVAYEEGINIFISFDKAIADFYQQYLCYIYYKT